MVNKLIVNWSPGALCHNQALGLSSMLAKFQYNRSRSYWAQTLCGFSVPWTFFHFFQKTPLRLHCCMHLCSTLLQCSQLVGVQGSPVGMPGSHIAHAELHHLWIPCCFHTGIKRHTEDYGSGFLSIHQRTGWCDLEVWVGLLASEVHLTHGRHEREGNGTNKSLSSLHPMHDSEVCFPIMNSPAKSPLDDLLWSSGTHGVTLFITFPASLSPSPSPVLL